MKGVGHSGQRTQHRHRPGYGAPDVRMLTTASVAGADAEGSGVRKGKFRSWVFIERAIESCVRL